MPLFDRVRLVLACLATVGCSTSATVKLTNGREVEGKILENRAGYLRVRSDSGVVAVRDTAVADIEHPGTPAVVTGAVLLGLSVPPFVALQTTSCKTRSYDGYTDAFPGCEFDRNFWLVPVTSALATGVTLTLWGLDAGASSRHRALSETGTPPQVPTAPPPRTPAPDPNWMPF